MASKLFVLSRSRAKLFQPEETWAGIQISHPQDSFPEISKVKNLAMLQTAFHDADHIDLLEGVTELFNEEQAIEIWRFVDDWWDKVEHFLVHCEAGLSRSPAVAAAIAKDKLGEDAEFFARFRPNMHVYRTMLFVRENSKRKAFHERS